MDRNTNYWDSFIFSSISCLVQSHFFREKGDGIDVLFQGLINSYDLYFLLQLFTWFWPSSQKWPFWRLRYILSPPITSDRSTLVPSKKGQTSCVVVKPGVVMLCDGKCRAKDLCVVAQIFLCVWVLFFLFCFFVQCVFAAFIDLRNVTFQ